MDTKDKLQSALKDAMRSGDQVRKQTIRLALSTIKLSEVNAQKALDENEILAIIQKEIKSRIETIESAKAAGREDMIKISNAEIKILEEFLPEQMGEEEIAKLASSFIDEMNATDMADMGKVMKALLPEIKGRAPNSLVSQVVRRLLNG